MYILVQSVLLVQILSLVQIPHIVQISTMVQSALSVSMAEFLYCSAWAKILIQRPKFNFQSQTIRKHVSYAKIRVTRLSCFDVKTH